MANKTIITETIGWYGAVAILSAYALVSFGVLSSSDYMYQILILSGAIGIVIILIVKKAQQPAFLNVVWAIIALVAILSLITNN